MSINNTQLLGVIFQWNLQVDLAQIYLAKGLAPMSFASRSLILGMGYWFNLATGFTYGRLEVFINIIDLL